MKFEALNNLLLEFQFEYKVPEDKEELLYDFYTLEAIRNYPPMDGSNWELRPNKDLQATLDSATDTLLDELREEMMLALQYALGAEFRHISDATKDDTSDTTMGDLQLKEKWFADFIHAYVREMNIVNPRFSVHGVNIQKDVKRSAKERALFKHSEAGRTKSYNAVKSTLDTLNMDMTTFVDAAELVFDKLDWDSSYGGKKWAGIARGWKHLYDTTLINQKQKEIPEMFIWIDHAYSLQHNNDTVLNKLKTYYRADSNYTWIKKALDHKRDTNDPWTLWQKSSRGMKMIAQRVLAAKGYGTVEDFFKNIDPPEKRSNTFGQTQISVTHSAEGEKWLDHLKKTKAEFAGAKDSESTKTISPNGTIQWTNSVGQLHRTDGPAYIGTDGYKAWWIDHAKYSEEDFNKHPDVIAFKKTQSKKSKFSQFDTTGLEVSADGESYKTNSEAVGSDPTTVWVNKHGEKHKNDGPAVIFDGYAAWYKNGGLHRIDGPAVVSKHAPDKWYFYSKEYSEKDFNKIKAVIKYKKDKEKKDSAKQYTSDGLGIKMVHNEFETWKLVGTPDLADELHNPDGPAYIDHKSGDKEWWLHGDLHRLDGPAVSPGTFNSSPMFYIQGRRISPDKYWKHPAVVTFKKNKNQEIDLSIDKAIAKHSADKDLIDKLVAAQQGKTKKQRVKLTTDELKSMKKSYDTDGTEPSNLTKKEVQDAVGSIDDDLNVWDVKADRELADLYDFFGIKYNITVPF